jgi:predicted nucleotidyltransferase
MINLKDKLKHLPAGKIAGLEFITDKIIETGLAEMVVLYGSHARGDYKKTFVSDRAIVQSQN